jgi:hypothetical protein
MPISNAAELEKAKDTYKGPEQGPLTEGLTDQPKHTEAAILDPILPNHAEPEPV